jgi:hypothetical protein
MAFAIRLAVRAFRYGPKALVVTSTYDIPPP